MTLTTSLLFALTRSNLPRQLPDGNETIPRLTEIVTASNSMGTYFWELLYQGSGENRENKMAGSLPVFHCF